MEEARAEQVAFGWAGEASDGEAREVRPSTTPPLRGGYAQGERTDGSHHAEREAGAAAAAAMRAPQPLPPDNELWDVHAAARFLKRSVSWVYHRVEDGTLPVKRLAGWGVRFIPAELRAWVQAGGGSRR